MTDDILAVLEECKQIFAELVMDGEIVTMDRLAIGLAMIAQLENRLMNGDLEDEDAPMATIDILQKNLSVRPKFAFADIHTSVLEAVYSACDSAEDGTLQGWETDLIESRIVSEHGGKKLLKGSAA